jgi:hypothetical protein
MAATSVSVLAFYSGGYFPSEWGLAALAPTLGIVGVLVLADEVRVCRRGALLVGALGLLGAWQLLSIAWSTGAGLPALEAERTLVYLCAATLLVLLLEPSRVTSLLAGIVAGVTAVAVYALGTRLLPGTIGGAYDPSSGYQLAKPIGYWNALGLLLVIAIVLAAGLALRGSRSLVAAATVALVPLCCSLYFTFSRGSFLALAVALVVLVVVEADRLRGVAQLAVLLAAPALGVLLASRSPALTATGATLQTAQEQGHRLAWQLLGLAFVAVVLAMLSGWASARVRLSPAARRGLGVAVVVALALATAGALVGAGGPASVGERVHQSFVAQPPPTNRGLERRLLSASGNGRADYWTVAARMVRRDPLLGDGAGSFAARWARERPAETEARDAHNLYLETLAELGPVGLALLLVALGSPLLALRRARGTVPAAAATAAYAAFLVHAALDWDWEVPLLVLVAIACATSLLALGPERSVIVLTARRRASGTAFCAVLVGAALVAHVGNRAVASAAEAIARDDPVAGATSAHRARTWMPWSHEPWQLLGEAQLEGGDDAAAAVSLRRATALDPGQWTVWYDLAMASRGLDRVNALTRARELSPRSVEVSDLAADISNDR